MNVLRSDTNSVPPCSRPSRPSPSGGRLRGRPALTATRHDGAGELRSGAEEWLRRGQTKEWAHKQTSCQVFFCIKLREGRHRFPCRKKREQRQIRPSNSVAVLRAHRRAKRLVSSRGDIIQIPSPATYRRLRIVNSLSQYYELASAQRHYLTSTWKSHMVARSFGSRDNVAGADKTHIIFFHDLLPCMEATSRRHKRRFSNGTVKDALKDALGADHPHIVSCSRFKEMGYKPYSEGRTIVFEKLSNVSTAIVYGLGPKDAQKIGQNRDLIIRENEDLPLYLSSGDSGAPVNISGRGDPRSWHLDTTESRDLQSVQHSKGERARVALLDTGVDAAHPEFSHMRIRRKTDDPHAVSDRKPELIVAAHDPFSGVSHDMNIANPHDMNGHGTSTASLVVGSSVGVAPHSDLCLCILEQSWDDKGRATVKIAAISRAINWLLDGQFRHGWVPNVIIFPFGQPQNSAKAGLQRTASALELAMGPACDDKEIFLVGSIGNDGKGRLWSPGAYKKERVYSVGASRQDNLPWENTSWGQNDEGEHQADAGAPGVEIPAAVPLGSGSTDYTERTGTSFAAPIVGGIVARLIETGQVSADRTQIATHLDRSAIPGTSGPNRELGVGIISL